MVRSSPRPGVPAYLKHSASGQAITVIRTEDGKRKQVYLGPHDSPESHRKYREILARYLNPAVEPTPPSGPPAPPTRWTVADVVARFLAWADTYYRGPDGVPTREYPNFHAASALLLKLYRDEAAVDFGPLKLKQVRELMVERGWSRRTVNMQTRRLKQMFKWAVENELVPGETFVRLQAVAGLKRGRTPAREPDPVRPVAWSDVEAILPHVPRIVSVMILLQWHTGMRPNEVVQIRTVDVDRTGPVWIYSPRRHKNAYRGHIREIYIGPEGQKVVQPFLRADPEAFLFQPTEAEQERSKTRRADRKTPLWKSHLRLLAERLCDEPQRAPGEHYSTASYRRAIHRACASAKVDQWSPNRLRHARATEVRRRFGLEAAQVILGHASADITQVYAEMPTTLQLAQPASLPDAQPRTSPRRRQASCTAANTTCHVRGNRATYRNDTGNCEFQRRRRQVDTVRTFGGLASCPRPPRNTR
jgi:integrase